MGSYDICIVGGGINGAGVAHEAVARGLKCCLIEKESEAGFWTSSRSSKLIHGGLRYLESFQFSLVNECLREREFLLKAYPELVKELELRIPVYKHSSRSKFKVQLGLWAYDLLSRKGVFSRKSPVKSSVKRSVPQSKRIELGEIALKHEDLVAAYSYYDARCRDQLLCQRIISDCSEQGLDVKFNSSVSRISYSGDSFHVEMDGGASSVQSDKLVNAGGPWVNILASQIEPKPKTIPIELVQGAHLVLDVAPEQHGYYLESFIDQRPFFILPHFYQGAERVLLGTTEKEFDRSPEEVRVTQEEVEYLLSSFNYYMPTDRRVSEEQILNSFAGLRVLPKKQENVSRRSRETIILPDFDRRYTAIYGGKYTSFLSTGRKVLGD